MSTASMEMAAPSGLLSLGLFLVAVALVTLLAGSLWLGCRIRSSQQLPRPEEQPQLPPEGAVHEVREFREPAEIPKVDKKGRALTPYELAHSASRPSASQERRRWAEGGSGSFGSGGLGPH
ncbi:DUF6479 family protein [Streptomyces sp. ME109]|uniref:DUF6479 family protein n=1 Tax=Streptomyces sp. me109 TaxID=1827853 RepID=UPI001651A950|nr:DUF6479 family protein [Streptomyces sp. me109]